MTIFQLYCKNLKTTFTNQTSFDTEVFKKYLEIYQKVYCFHKEKNNYQNNMKEYIDKVDALDIYNYVKIGLYFLNHQYTLDNLKRIQKNNNNYYLLVPGYDNCFECEIQLGLSGSVKFRETPHRCLQREIEEELGVTVKEEDIKKLKKIRNVNFYEIEIKNNYFIKERLKIDLSKQKDSRDKVSCLIYGELDYLTNLLSKTKLPYHFIEGESISHTLLIPINLAVILLETIMSYRCDKYNHAKGCRLLYDSM